MGKIFGKKNKMSHDSADCMNALKKTMEHFKIPQDFYSIGNYAEEAMCIEEKDNKWSVYGGERGDKHNLKIFYNGYEACEEYLLRLAENRKNARKMMKFFREMLTACEAEKSMSAHIWERGDVNFSPPLRKPIAVKFKVDKSCKKRYSFYHYRYFGVGRPDYSELFLDRCGEREAIREIKNVALSLPDQSGVIGAHLKICDPPYNRYGQSKLRGTVRLPKTISKQMRILVFAEGDEARAAREAKADYVGADELIQRIVNEKWFDYDVVIATPQMMKKVEKIGNLLGPKGLMPNAACGTLTRNTAKAVIRIRNGEIDYLLHQTRTINVPLCRVNLSEETLEKNLNVIVHAVNKSKPDVVKGSVIDKVYLSSPKGGIIDVISEDQ